MSDNSIPSSAGESPYSPPPAAPVPPAQQPHQAYPGAAPAYGQPAPTYGQQAPTYGQQAPTYGQPAPSYGQPSSAALPYGAPAQPPVQQPYGAAPGYGYAQNPYPVYPAPRPASGLAITSLVTGIVSVVFSWLGLPALAAIVAVITGHMALKKTKADPSIGGRGMAFAGLIIGYVMLGVIAIMIIVTIFTFAMFGAFTLPFLYNS